MRNTINNGMISITVKDHGAELCSIKTNVDGKEYMWEGDPKIWGKHAPLLFPIVGCLKDGHFTHEGKAYKLPRHGFARDLDFDSVVGNGDNQLRYVLRSSAQTKEIYPFDFELLITYQLIDKSVDTIYEVKNKGDQPMFFSIGAHPAFKCPMADGGQVLQFETPVTLERYILSPETGLIEKGRILVLKNQPQLSLSYPLFDQDALIFDTQGMTSVTLKDEGTGAGVKMSFEGFPYLGIWSPKAPFVCIEPWYGITDEADVTGQLADKKGMIELQPGMVFTCTHRIEILG